MFPYAMIRMNGIELAEGGTVRGIYNEISRKVYDDKVILYDWYIAGVLIVPHVFNVQFNPGSILLNGLVKVTESDEVYVPVVSQASAYVVSYYVNDLLVRRFPVIAGDTAPRQLIMIDEHLYDYPAIVNVEEDMSVEMLPVTTFNFEFRQIYLSEYDLVFSESGDVTVIPRSTSGLSGRYGVVLRALYDVAPVFVAKSNQRQYGRCGPSAVLPGILNSGAGRIWYSQYTNDIEVRMTFYQDQDYFIEVDMTGYVTIKNFIH